MSPQENARIWKRMIAVGIAAVITTWIALVLAGVQ